MLKSAVIARPLRVSETHCDPCRVEGAGPKAVQFIDNVRDQNAYPTSPQTDFAKILDTSAVLSNGLPKIRSGLVRRLVCACDDSGKELIRSWLIDLDDAQLQSGLGLTVEDIAVLRTCTKTA